MDVASWRGLACGLIDRPMMKVSLIGHGELIEMPGSARQSQALEPKGGAMPHFQPME